MPVEDILLQFIIPFFIIILLVIALFWYRKNNLKLRIKHIVKKISFDYLEDVIIDNGAEQYAQYDYIVLNDNGIIVLDIKNYAGNIFAAEKINEWTQVIDRNSYMFRNPFFDLSQKLDLLRNDVADLELSALIVFTDKAFFPKGRPDSVLTLNELKERFTMRSKKIPDEWRTQWAAFKRSLEACE